jgi:hypothetical protein
MPMASSTYGMVIAVTWSAEVSATLAICTQ